MACVNWVKGKNSSKYWELLAIKQQTRLVAEFLHTNESYLASQVVLIVKNPLPSAGDKRDTGLIPGMGRSSGGGHGNPLQYPCLEKPMDPWWATVHAVAKSQTRLKWLSTHACNGLQVQLFLSIRCNEGKPWWLSGKESACHAASIPGLGRSPGGGNGKALQCSCLENLTDRGSWRATACGVAKSRMPLSTHACRNEEEGVWKMRCFGGGQYNLASLGRALRSEQSSPGIP